MIAPNFPDNEKLRQKAVEKYNLLDSLPEESYDNITSLMSYITETPISLITLLDKNRNFLKSHHGIPFSESPRNISFCGHTINSPENITIIKDAREDNRFHDNPLVTEQGAIFYAGVPLIDSDGFKLGTLCVYDVKPRQLSDEQIKALLSMSKQVINLFEQRYQNLKLIQLQEKLKKRNEDLQKFANVVSHDLKSPLANIISLTELLEDESKDKLNKDAKEYLEYLKTSSNSLKDYIDGMLTFYKSDDLIKDNYSSMDFESLINELESISIPSNQNIIFNYPKHISKHITINKPAVVQILVNLVTNALKYNDKDIIKIDINFYEKEDFYKFEVIDNGIGIPAESIDSIFNLFSIVGISDREGEMGTGIGLATVKKMVTSLGGNISVISEESVGTTFQFTVAKV